MLNVRFTNGEGVTIEGEISLVELKAIQELKPTLEHDGRTYKATDLYYDMQSGRFTVWFVEGGGTRCVSSE